MFSENNINFKDEKGETEEMNEKKERLNKIFKDIKADAVIQSILNGDFQLVKDIYEEEVGEDLKISFSFKHKNEEFLNSYLDSVNYAIYTEIEKYERLPEILKERFGLEVDGDNKLISPTFFVIKTALDFDNLKAEAKLTLRDIKKMLGIKEGK